MMSCDVLLKAIRLLRSVTFRISRKIGRRSISTLESLARLAGRICVFRLIVTSVEMARLACYVHQRVLAMPAVRTEIWTALTGATAATAAAPSPAGNAGSTRLWSPPEDIMGPAVAPLVPGKQYRVMPRSFAALFVRIEARSGPTIEPEEAS